MHAIGAKLNEIATLGFVGTTFVFMILPAILGEMLRIHFRRKPHSWIILRLLLLAGIGMGPILILQSLGMAPNPTFAEVMGWQGDCGLQWPLAISGRNQIMIAGTAPASFAGWHAALSAGGLETRPMIKMVRDKTKHDSQTAELALAHKVGGVEGAYRRRTALEKRRDLMEQWAKYCESAEVISISTAA
jgi:hypothetical protein